MNFEDAILDKINLLNSVLTELGNPHLFENPDFLIDNDWTSEFYLKLKVAESSQNKLPINISLSKDGIQIDVDVIMEAFEWSSRKINESRDEVTNFIKKFFTSYILIENCGSSKFLHFFESSGEFSNTYAYNSVLYSIIGLNIKRDCYKKLYLPLYPPK